MAEIKTVAEAEDYLNQIPMWASRKNSLESIRDFLTELGSPDESLKIIHVAGTNGKGSVCAYMTSILNKAGYKAGTFISPHLISTKERFLIDGAPVKDKGFLQAFDRIKELSGNMVSRGYLPPTYFEYLFYMFMALCQKEKPDFVILETGMGGLLDTTNVIKNPLMTVITSVSMDHMQFLGTTLAEIAAQKAGILKEGRPVVYDAGCPESSQVIRRRARQLHCPLYPVGEEDYRLAGRDPGGVRILVEADGEPVEFRISSQADYQMMNGTLAVKAAGLLKEIKAADIRTEHMRDGVKSCFWPGRMEEVLPGVYLDGAHNTGGMEALTRTLKRMQEETGGAVTLMFGVVSDKEYHRMIEELCSALKISHVTIAHMGTARSVEADCLAREFRQRLGCPVEAFSSVKEAWEHFLREKGDGPAFCAGSLYLVGEVKALLRGDGND